MADVAARAGVSRQLASLALRDEPGASAESRRRVKAAAAELGYVVNRGAQRLREPGSRQIGVAFVPTHATEPDIVEAIYDAAADTKYQIVLSAQTRSRTTDQAVDELIGYRCAAVIVIGSELAAAGLAALAERARMPLVAVGQGEASTTYDVVRSAGGQGVELVVNHLIGLGHRRIAYVEGESMPAGFVRRSGYLTATAAAGIGADVVTVGGLHYTEESGSAAARQILERDRLPTAIVASNDQQAVGVLQVLARAGVSVPDQVSLAGFDDSRFARLSSVHLTTARQDPEQMGAAAFTAAVRRISRPTLVPALAEVETTLIVRSSTAVPRPE